MVASSSRRSGDRVGERNKVHCHRNSYDVFTTLSQGLGGLIANITYGPEGRPRGDVGGPNLYLNTLVGGNGREVAYSLWAAGHEFGHSLGLQDEYDYATLQPFPGFEHEIMGAPNGTPTGGTIDRVLSNCTGSK